jgi:dCTP deaminase
LNYKIKGGEKMILSDGTLKELIEKRYIEIEPLSEGQIQPASVDLRLSNYYLKVDENMLETIDLEKEIVYQEIIRDEIIIPPHSFLLATTLEKIKLPSDITAFVEGRSSIGRMGLFIQNAGWVDPGYNGSITLELYNANRLPIKLYSGRRVCQLVFARTDRDALIPYSGKYQNSSKATGSRAFLDIEVKATKI